MVKTCKIILPILLFIAFSPSVFAYTVTQTTFTQSTSGNMSDVTFYTASYSQIGADDLYSTDSGDLVSADITIPISIYKSGLSPASGYLNGYYKFTYDITITGSENTDFRNFNVDFEPVENDGIFFAYYTGNKTSTSNSYKLKYNLYFVFKNFYWSSTYGQTILTAKVHYSDLATNGSTFQCTIVPEISAGSGSLNHSAQGIVDESLSQSIADAINDSTDVDLMLNYLSAISSDTSLLTQVLSKLTDLDTKLATVLTRLQTIDTNTNRAQLFLENILRALAGTSDLTTDISSQAKQRWVSIISDALKNIQPSVPDKPDLRDDINSQQANNDVAESAAYDDLDTAIDNVSLSPVAPGNIVSAIISVTDWLDLIYTRLGVIQWVIIFTCTTGIILIVLGRFRMK